ncbi:MAG: hypothetical protein OXN44_11560 [Acidimicrobiaceae bacterium]|nr:hypothetical protein [Acidimicrobiaceae bacterium]MDE0606179.1 hypothetical protein [Acidimicrobiaceae bacterium]
MAESGSAGDDEGRFDEVREAGEAFLASLRWLIEATERALEDPRAMAAVAATGKSFIDAFTRGFRFSDSDAGSEPSGEAEPNGDDADACVQEQ